MLHKNEQKKENDNKWECMLIPELKCNEASTQTWIKNLLSYFYTQSRSGRICNGTIICFKFIYLNYEK